MPDINADLLRIARQRKRFSQGEAAKKLGVTQAFLSRYENAASVPNEDFLIKAAQVYELPKSLFYQPDQVIGLPVSVHPMWRKKNDVSVKEIDGIIAELNLRILHLRRMLRAVEFLPQSDIPMLEPEEYGGDIEKIAGLVRAHWQIPQGAFHNLTAAVEKAGAIVIHSPLDGSNVSGLTVRVSDLPPIIILNQDQPADRMRFTLAHEIGHLVMHKFPNPNMEKEANEFASALLMPATDIKHAYTNWVDMKRLAAMKPEWKVSMQALLYRAQTLKLIDEEAVPYLWRQFNKNGWKMREPSELDFPPEETGVLSKMIKLHLDTFGYSKAEFANIIHLHEYQLEQFYNSRGNPEKGTGLRLRVVK